MKLGDWIEKAFWALLLWAAMNMSGNVTKLSESVNELNTKFAVFISKGEGLERSVGDHEARIRLLEAKKVR